VNLLPLVLKVLGAMAQCFKILQIYRWLAFANLIKIVGAFTVVIAGVGVPGVVMADVVTTEEVEVSTL
jgi:hypothetical protein